MFIEDLIFIKAGEFFLTKFSKVLKIKLSVFEISFPVTIAF